MAKGLGAGACDVGLAWASGVPLPAIEVAATAMLVGFVGYGASLVLFVIALRHLGSARTAAYFSTAPFIGALLAVVGFGAPASAGLAIAGALMALGVVLHATERHDHHHDTRCRSTSTPMSTTTTTGTTIRRGCWRASRTPMCTGMRN